jgi:uncharacterized membrane protein
VRVLLRGDRLTTRRQLGLAAALLVATLAACGGGGGEPTPTGATCTAEGAALTYEDFGAPFMAAYCTRCHSSELRGEDRDGAPVFHDFDSLIGILNVSDHVDEQAGIGPDAENRFMPPDGTRPTDDERRQLAAWVVCELDRLNAPDAGAL